MRSRRRSSPWIHRFSRQIIGAIALLGAALTAYITVVKLTGGNAVCPTSGCEQVLNSDYATVFGLPLSLFGCLAYISMATFALAPLAVRSEDNKDLSTNLNNWTWLLLFAGATAMSVFSSYLMYLLAFQIKAVCLYCFASAAFSFSFLILTLIGRAWEDVGQLFFTAIVVGMVALIGTLGVYAHSHPAVANNSPSLEQENPNTPLEPPNVQPNPAVVGWPITHPSGEAENALAKHLTDIGAKMYGAYWCPHCYQQKQLFGREAFHLINYIECAPDGKNSQTDICRQEDIQGYPTWVINGKKVASGVQTLEQLANLSDYKGPRNFKYTFNER